MYLSLSLLFILIIAVLCITLYDKEEETITTIEWKLVPNVEEK
jgi:hypothetical protein